MQIKQEDWKKILQWVRDKMLEEMQVMRNAIGLPVDVVKKFSIEAIPLLDLKEFLKDTGEKKEKKKREVSDNPEWEKFYQYWPATKSVPGAADPKYKSGKSFKGNEPICRRLWEDALDVVRAERLLHAAKVYITYGIKDSYKKGSNQMEYLNALEPWLRQQKFLNYVDMEIPEVPEQDPDNSYNCA